MWTILPAVVLFSQTAAARTSLDIHTGTSQAVLSPLHQPWALGIGAGGGVSFDLSPRWRLRAGIDWRRLWDDTTTTSVVKIPHPDRRAARAWTQFGLSLTAERRLGVFENIEPFVGFGAAWTGWSVESYPGYGRLDVENSHRDSVSYAADELTLLLTMGVAPRLFSNVRLRTQVGLNVFTGVGTDFPRAVNDDRSHAQLTFAIGLLIPLSGAARRGPPDQSRRSPFPGTAQSADSIPLDHLPSTVAPAPETTVVVNGGGAMVAAAVDSSGMHSPPVVVGVDADSDGVDDRLDRCPDTPAGALVDTNGCPTDGDGDGVFDGIDQCPKTPRLPGLVVDADGCPHDEDGDGVPDYLDNCPQTAPGTTVDAIGCPRDGDKDGVPDDRDLCPDTPSGLTVDSTGCLVMTQLRRRLILYINYLPGTTAPDPISKRILNDVAVRLKNAPKTMALIEGFTDNIGEGMANLNVSQKRANRIKQYLVRRGVPLNRLNAIGRGETRFVASNKTAAGRRKNRRIEISFHRMD